MNPAGAIWRDEKRMGRSYRVDKKRRKPSREATRGRSYREKERRKKPSREHKEEGATETSRGETDHGKEGTMNEALRRDRCDSSNERTPGGRNCRDDQRRSDEQAVEMG